MGNYDLRMSLQTGLDPTCLPVPKNDIPLAITAANPLAVRRESNLASVSGSRVTRETLFPVLPEVVCAIDQDLVVEGLRREIFV